MKQLYIRVIIALALAIGTVASPAMTAALASPAQKARLGWDQVWDIISKVREACGFVPQFRSLLAILSMGWASKAQVVEEICGAVFKARQRAAALKAAGKYGAANATKPVVRGVVLQGTFAK